MHKNGVKKANELQKKKDGLIYCTEVENGNGMFESQGKPYVKILLASKAQLERWTIRCVSHPQSRAHWQPLVVKQPTLTRHFSADPQLTYHRMTQHPFFNYCNLMSKKKKIYLQLYY